MSVCHRPNHFPQRRATRKHGSVFLPQRRHDACKILAARRPPLTDPADRTLLAAYVPGIADNDLFNGFRTVSFIWDHHVRQFVMQAPAAPATQPPDNQRLYLSAAADDLSFSAANNIEFASAHWAYADLFASYVKFPAKSISTR